MIGESGDTVLTATDNQRIKMDWRLVLEQTSEVLKTSEVNNRWDSGS